MPFRPSFLAAPALCVFALAAPDTSAQQLEPYAYAANPVGINLINVGYIDAQGAILFDPSVGITDVDSHWRTLIIGYGRTFNLFGRMASFAAVIPATNGDASGNVQEEFSEVSRSGIADPTLRLSVNLAGAPALSPAEFAGQEQSLTLGATLVVVPPLGQYFPDKLINLGSNRWSFKTELGLSYPKGPWRWELSAGAWFFTDNKDFFGGQLRSQDPITTVQAHVIYSFKPKLWLAFNSTWYGGGRSSLDGVVKADFQSNTRLGLTLSVPIKGAHSMRAGFSTGVTTRIGGSFDQLSLVWQYAWF
jgi:hypothetical protein